MKEHSRFKLLTALVCISLLALACNRSRQVIPEPASMKDQVRIDGFFMGGEGRQVSFEEMAVREYIPIDTLVCDGEGRFQINFESGQTAFYVLRAGPSGYITMLIEPGEIITIRGQYGQTDTYRVEGSAGSEQLMRLAAEHKRTLAELGEITRLNMEYQDRATYRDLKMQLDVKFDSITASFRNYSQTFIERNHESLSILIALYNLYGRGLPVFDPGKDFPTYLFVDSILQSRYPEFEAAGLLHAQILESKTFIEADEPDRRPGMGEIAPDFVSSRPDGSQIALSDFKGRYVLLSFWAGWSKPSREENHFLKDAWRQFGMLNFSILQVSFDEEKETWTGAIEQDGLTWDHVSDLRRWESAVADLYQVEKIPENYLINPKGRIIARDLNGDELVEQLENLLSKD